MRKMKRTVKKEKGLERRIEREKFLQELKNPTPKPDTGQDVLDKIRQRQRQDARKIYKRKSASPYDCGSDGVGAKTLEKLRKMAGLQ